MEDNCGETSQPVNGEISPFIEPPDVSASGASVKPPRWIWQGEIGPAFWIITGASANIVLPAGTKLPSALNITVPFSNTVPVNLIVPVDIPLNQDDLHEPFVGLQNVVSPFMQWMESLPDSREEAQMCTGWSANICDWLMGSE